MKMTQILSVFMAFLIATPGMAAELPVTPAPSATPLFRAYLNNQAKSEDVVASLLADPQTYLPKVKELVEVIKAEGLLSGDETTANKVYRLQADMNEAVLAYNEGVDARRFSTGLRGAGIGLVVGWLVSVGVDRWKPQSTAAYALGLFFVYLPVGAYLGKKVSDGIDYVYNGGKFEPNSLLDNE